MKLLSCRFLTLFLLIICGGCSPAARTHIWAVVRLGPRP